MSADGQPSPRTLLVQMSAGGLPTCRMLTKDEGQDEEEEVVTGMVTTEAVLLPDDQEGMQFEGTVVEAVEEVEDEEGLDEESMGSGVAMDDGGAALLCKMESSEKGGEIWVLGDIITVDEQTRCLLGDGGPEGGEVSTEGMLGGPKHGCADCGKEFTTVFHLRRHRRIHTGERPYPCKVCGQCFRHSTSLKVHMRRHTGEEPFMCTVCNKTFKDPANFKVGTARLVATEIVASLDNALQLPL
ncbi:zinc finger protein 501 [Ixodes scapularis]